MKMAAVAIHPAPYREPFFSVLSRMPELDFEALYAPEPLPWKPWASEHVFTVMPPEKPSWKNRFYTLKHYSPQVRRELERLRPDVLLCYGYERWPMLGAILWAFKRRIPVMFRHDGTCLDPVSTPKHWSRRLLGAWLLRHRCSALVIGTSNKLYWKRELGFPEERLFWSPYAVDNERFAAEAQRHRVSRERMKREWGWADKQVLLFAGRLVAVKNVPLLLKAFQTLKTRRPGVTLLIVGDGPERPALESMVPDTLRGDVRFAGNAAQEELPRYYAVADLFVLPSTAESWGLVVNEAMACGLPVLVSDRVGAHEDLVRQDYNGGVFHSGSEKDLAAAMERLLTADLAEMGARSREMIRAFSPEAELAGFQKALDGMRAGVW